jgi:hypothetical protein
VRRSGDPPPSGIASGANAVVMASAILPGNQRGPPSQSPLAVAASSLLKVGPEALRNAVSSFLYASALVGAGVVAALDDPGLAGQHQPQAAGAAPQVEAAPTASTVSQGQRRGASDPSIGAGMSNASAVDAAMHGAGVPPRITVGRISGDRSCNIVIFDFPLNKVPADTLRLVLDGSADILIGHTSTISIGRTPPSRTVMFSFISGAARDRVYDLVTKDKEHLQRLRRAGLRPGLVIKDRGDDRQRSTGVRSLYARLVDVQGGQVQHFAAELTRDVSNFKVTAAASFSAQLQAEARRQDPGRCCSPRCGVADGRKSQYVH